MEVHFKPDLEAKLSRLAAEQGRNSEEIVIDAVERIVSYDEWFVANVDKGISDANQDNFVEHGEIRKLLDNRFRG